MNCKPDDIAILVNSHAETERCVGQIFQLTSFCGCGAGDDPCFKFEGSPLKGRSGWSTWIWHCLPDAWLRPIRPGDLTQEDVDALYLPEVIKQRDPEAA